MPVSRAVALVQVWRFRTYLGFPTDDEAAQEQLLQAFQEECSSDEHCRATGNELEGSLHYSPKRADIREAVERLAEQARYVTTPTPFEFPGDFDRSFYEIWTDRDAAIHEALVKEGTAAAQKLAKQTLAGWKAFCATQPDHWEVPLFNRSNPKHRAFPRKEYGERMCTLCFDTGWEYLGEFSVRRCSCKTHVSRKASVTPIPRRAS